MPIRKQLSFPTLFHRPMRYTGYIAFVYASAVLSACMPVPPARLAPRTGTEVQASFGRTWDATIDAFAERGISIETLDRSSGLIVPAGRTYAPGVDDKDALRYADCGKNGFGQFAQPETVKYNVVVRGDSTRSTVLVRAFYRGNVQLFETCESTGLFETQAELNIKEKAERRP